MKDLSNQNTADAVKTTPDIFVKGNPDEWQLICKASSKDQGWMKSTKAMICAGGVTLLVTSEFRDSHGVVTACSETMCFIPAAKIDQDGEGFRIV